MAKKEYPIVKPNCEYCKNGTNIGNHMSGCLFHSHPRANGINGLVQCSISKFELDEEKHKEWITKKKSPT